MNKLKKTDLDELTQKDSLEKLLLELIEAIEKVEAAIKKP